LRALPASSRWCPLPTDILDNELLAERARHVLADDAGNDIRRSARGERHDDGDGA